MTEHLSGAESGPAAKHAPSETGAYDITRPNQVQAFVPKPGQHFRLPDDIMKAHAVATTCRALRLLGASERMIAVWRHVADMTERQAWHADDRAPVNWKRQCDLAREMGLGERQFRRIEAELSRLGVLARMTADNGYRGRRSGQPARDSFSCGLSLEPAIANFRAFARIVEEAELAEEARHEAILNARIARRRVGLLVASLKDIEMRRWAKRRLVKLEEAVRPVRPRVASHEELSIWHTELLALEDSIREAQVSLPAPAASAERVVPPSFEAVMEARNAPKPDSEENDPLWKTRDLSTLSVSHRTSMSAAPDIDDRSHIQPTTESRSICKNSDSPERAETVSDAAPGPGFPLSAQGEGARRHASPLSPTLGARLTERDIRGIASDDVALWLDAMAWQDALPHVLRELGVNVSAWHDACDAMGEPVAFLALIVIDRNRFHPDTPILNPGGTLRAFTRRARCGDLDLTRSILGIWERERQGRQPKGPHSPRRPS